MASFQSLSGIAVDAAGNLYVTETVANKIRKLTATGVVSTLAGSGNQGSRDGPGNTASFTYPLGIAVDVTGNVYVANSDIHKIRKITGNGVVSTFAGTGVCGTTDGVGTSATFCWPDGVAVDSNGSLYVADRWGNKIRKITAAGVVSTLAGSGVAGSVDGVGTNATFHYPKGIAVDASGNVFVSQTGSPMIRKITSGGVVTTLAGSSEFGSDDGNGVEATFKEPTSVAVDSVGNVYVADVSNYKIRKITSSGVVSTIAGSGTTVSADGVGINASFSWPRSLAVDSAGNVYVADGNKVRKLTPQ